MTDPGGMPISRSDGESEPEYGVEHEVTPLELFFDLVLVFAVTQVTRLLAADATWSGVLRGMLVLAALWWAWHVYTWLTSTIDIDEGGVRLAMLASMAAMFGVALAVRAPSETTGCCSGPPTSSCGSFISSFPASSVATTLRVAAPLSASRRPRSSAPRC
jgi:hypothetical protein